MVAIQLACYCCNRMSYSVRHYATHALKMEGLQWDNKAGIQRIVPLKCWRKSKRGFFGCPDFEGGDLGEGFEG